MAWELIGHVDPPPPVPSSTRVDGSGELVEYERSLIFYLGPNHYPAGLYLVDGYDLESRPGDDDGWTILRARDTASGQVLTMWATNDDRTADEQVRILDT